MTAYLTHILGSFFTPRARCMVIFELVVAGIFALGYKIAGLAIQPPQMRLELRPERVKQ
jgi:hypothetical protein